MTNLDETGVPGGEHPTYTYRYTVQRFGHLETLSAGPNQSSNPPILVRIELLNTQGVASDTPKVQAFILGANDKVAALFPYVGYPAPPEDASDFSVVEAEGEQTDEPFASWTGNLSQAMEDYMRWIYGIK